MAALNPMIAQLYGAGKTEEVGKTGMQGIWFWPMFGRIRHAVDVGDDYAFPSLADIERLCRRHDGAIYVLYQLGNASSHDTPRPACLCLQLEPSARDYVGQLCGICVECAAKLCVRLRQIWYACFGWRRLRHGNGGGILVQRIGFVALYRQRKFFRQFGLTAKIGKPDLAAFKQIWKIGAPIGLSYFLEASAFSFIVFWWRHSARIMSPPNKSSSACRAFCIWFRKASALQARYA